MEEFRRHERRSRPGHLLSRLTPCRKPTKSRSQPATRPRRGPAVGDPPHRWGPPRASRIGVGGRAQTPLPGDRGVEIRLITQPRRCVLDGMFGSAFRVFRPNLRDHDGARRKCDSVPLRRRRCSCSPWIIRHSFAETILGVPKERDSSELKKLRDAKLVIYEGGRRVLAEGISQGRAGVLVDEHLGSEVARRAKQDGFVLAMPIEKSGTELFELEYGEKFAAHVEKFDPDFSKVLVRYNPADDESTRATANRTPGPNICMGPRG